MKEPGAFQLQQFPQKSLQVREPVINLRVQIPWSIEIKPHGVLRRDFSDWAILVSNSAFSELSPVPQAPPELPCWPLF
jgi:hypothetical protein